MAVQGTVAGDRLVNQGRLAGASGCELAGVLGPLVPAAAVRALKRSGVRQRVFTPTRTFWEFLAQILSPGQSCRETVRRVQAGRLRLRRPPISPRTGAYPPDALARLYLLRWRVELFFAHIKTVMRMDVLRCHTPHMIRRELHMQLAAYNAIRALMLEAAARSHTPLDGISFKGACDALRQFAPHLAATANHPPTYRRLVCLLLDTLAEDQVPLRRPRSEPRAVKRRPKITTA